MDIQPPKRYKAPSQPTPAPTPPPEEKLPEVRPLPENTRPKRTAWHVISAALIGLVVVVAIAILATLWWYNDSLQPLNRGEDRHEKVSVVTGSTAEDIAKQLSDAKLIKNSLAFRVYLELSGKKATLQAGSYVLSPTQSVPEIVDVLAGGKIDAYDVTILPGKTVREIKQKLAHDGFSTEEIEAAFAKDYDHPLLAEKPEGASLEGYVYPETYQVNSNTTVEDLLTRSFDEFYKLVQEQELVEKLKTQNLTLYQGMILASIVEREISDPTDAATVAQVFLKRLSIDMMLGADATFVYAAKETGQPQSVSIDSPYNTRKYKGLPPTPIANFGVRNLVAITNPASTDYLFYVTGDDGTFHYSHTEEEHQQKVQQFCTKLCN